MKPLYKSLLLAALQVSLVCTLGAKLLYERAHRPRVWIKSAVYDPNLPIRGKYLSLMMELPAEGFTSRMQTFGNGNATQGYEFFSPSRCDVVLRGDQLIAVGNEDGEYWTNVHRGNPNLVAQINGEIAFFLPENKWGPSLHRGEELWFEATVPRKGPPRPLRLGIKKDGVLTPLPSE
jgi:hypothetical protein